MALYKISIQTELDVSLSPGDELYIVKENSMTNTFGVTTASNFNKFGTITRIGPIGEQGVVVNGVIQVTENSLNEGDIEFESGASTTFVEGITSSDFIFFRKNQVVNKSGLKGYYTSIDFRNNIENEAAELFAIGSEVSGSSK